MPPFLAGPLPAATAPLVELEDLVRFAGHPTRAFLRQRLGISVGDYSDEVDDALPVELDALERWGVGQRLLDGVLAGASIEACVAAEIARGTLPPGQLANPVIAEVRPIVAHIAAAANTELDDGAEPASVDVKVALDDGRTLSGTVPGVYGDVLRTVTYSRVNARHRLAAYVRWLALTAAHPERPFAAATIGQARSRRARQRDDHDRPDPAARGRRGRARRAGAEAARDARRPLRPRHARAAPARLHVLGGLRRRPRSPAPTPRRPGARRGSRPGSSPRRTPTSSTSSCAAASSASTS